MFEIALLFEDHLKVFILCALILTEMLLTLKRLLSLLVIGNE